MDAIRPIIPAAITAIADPVSATAAASAGSPTDFINALGAALERVDGAQHHADKLARAYQMGEEGVTLESSMIAIQEANVSLQFAVQVRNKLVSAYHDIMNMPV